MTLAEFLLARIAEDEAAAGEAIGQAAFSSNTGEWRAEDVCDQYGPTPLIFAIAASGAKTQVADFSTAHDREERRAHIARHDPARVLAECEAKRRIVVDPLLHTFVSGEGISVAGARILRALALPYADHADYREEWRP